ncbi:uncharacterized protein KY384_005770 [Bacidia gigantensis]|uniref:uncharacterized protein n=1 Tax=Bacidia gigantensis TaxID=2732470 RepID=UPI001D03E37E|nr:uncharacterized protein KY384_005770 [Bacidia gigantensis]KAG8529135.1 hypothetical protein KY384_005770 [Bacidia gigantensis]
MAAQSSRRTELRDALASPPQSPAHADPESPRKRTRLSRMTEDSNGDMLIEQYLYYIEPYRSSSSMIPYPWPLELEKAPIRYETLSNDPQFREALTQQLKVHKIPNFSASFHTQSKPGYEPHTQRTVALHIQVNVNPDMPDFE